MSAVEEYNASLEGSLADVARALTARLDAALPGATRQIWHTHPVWMNGKLPLAGFKAYPRWITFMTWGDVVTDTSGTLQQGNRMATAKFTSVNEIDSALVDGWLAQVAATL